MLKEFLVPAIPVVGGLIAAGLNFVQNTNKQKNEVIKHLGEELLKRPPNPYIVEACVVRIHRCRPIPFRILKRLLRLSNALEIIQLVSPGRRILDLFRFSEISGQISVEYRIPFTSFAQRAGTALLCLFVLGICYSAAVYYVFELMARVDDATWRNFVNPEVAVGAFYIALMLAITLFLCFVSAWQLYVIGSAASRLKKVNALLDENYGAIRQKMTGS